MAKLYLMTGIPGSGKTTYIQKNLEGNEIHISRDTVRFSMLDINDDYFAKEKAVFKEWIYLIQKNLDMGVDVYADATHLTKNSRQKTLNALKLNNHSVHVVNIITNLDVALKRNKKRSGRAYVPEEVIKNMKISYIPATLNENLLYKSVTSVRGGNGY